MIKITDLFDWTFKPLTYKGFFFLFKFPVLLTKMLMKSDWSYLEKPEQEKAPQVTQSSGKRCLILWLQLHRLQTNVNSGLQLDLVIKLWLWTLRVFLIPRKRISRSKKKSVNVLESHVLDPMHSF